MQENQRMKKIREGSIDSFRLMYLAYYSWLCSYIYKLTLDKALAEDLVQDVFTKLWERRRQIVVATNLKSYLFRSCHNEFLQYVRKSKKHDSLLEALKIQTIYEVYELDSHEDEKQLQIEKLEALINQLPPKCREVFIKSKYEQLKYKEIATEMGISVKTVEAQMSKALLFLRKNS